MEHLKSYYTLEKHLEESAIINKQFEILSAIWKLNKKNLSLALSNISQYYPHYSLHERSHSKTIISNIESFLGEERIKRLSPTNTWLILMSAYTHDLGMIVFQDLIQKEWLSENFQEFLQEISESDIDELKGDASILIYLQSIKNENQSKINEDLTPIKIKNAVITIVAEYIRRIHHERSSNIIKGADKQFYEIANSFYSEQIPKRLLNILGEIAFLHGVEFYEIFKRLEFESNGISSDKINPRLVACLLRLGDLLDVDDSRFNNFTKKVFEYPESSKNHIIKHASIKHILITPEAIEITSDCPTEEVYRLSRNWFDWLEDEVEKQSKEWSNIAPIDLGGSSPTIPKGKIKVYYNSQEVDDKLLNLRFEVSNQKIFEILEGASIYEKSELTFIRELVQNALDASKIQLWKEIERGTFDFVFKNHFNDNLLNHDEIIKKIQFPKDIPESLYNSFEVSLNIFWKEKDQENLIFEISDNGTGISNTDLIRMTNKVGESRKREKDFKVFLNRMPFWLKPTGAFGIGLQSVFIVTDNFKVITKFDGEQTKEIFFRSSKKRKYSSVNNIKTEFNRGTKIIIEIPKSKFEDIFGGTFSFEIIENYDYFTDKHRSIYIPKIYAYVKEVLSSISTLKFTYFSEVIPYEKLNNSKSINIDFRTDISNKVQCGILHHDQKIFFEFYENIIGSEFYLYFNPDLSLDIDEKWNINQVEYYVREIPVKSNILYYNKLYYSKFIWNFMSTSSDKILSLTREKFISRKKRELENIFFENVLPIAITEAEKIFLDNYEKLHTEYNISLNDLATTYFKIILTKYINNLKGCEVNKIILEGVSVPNDLAEDTAGRQIKMSEFFDYDYIILPVFTNNQFRSELLTIELNKQTIIDRFIHLGDKVSVLLIKHSRFFESYLTNKYYVKEIYFTETYKILLFTKHKQAIKVNEGHNFFLRSILRRHSLTERGTGYAIDKYYNALATPNIFASGFEHFPDFTNIAIISPFKSLKQYLSFKDEIKSDNYEDLISIDRVRNIVPQKLVDWLREHKPDDVSNRTEDEIYEAYRKLIIDFLENDA